MTILQASHPGDPKKSRPMTQPRNDCAPEPPNNLGGRSYDERYEFGRLPRAVAPFPFSRREFARPLVLRGRVHDGGMASDDRALESPRLRGEVQLESQTTT
jgi:hypothetical protein